MEKIYYVAAAFAVIAVLTAMPDKKEKRRFLSLLLDPIQKPRRVRILSRVSLFLSIGLFLVWEIITIPKNGEPLVVAIAVIFLLVLWLLYITIIWWIAYGIIRLINKQK